jgi:ribose 5-phosphate isomerase B
MKENKMPKKVAVTPKKVEKTITIALGADPMGAVLKNAVKKHLQSEGYKVIDYGTDCAENFVTYFGISAKTAKAVQKGIADKGIVFCGTGMGVGITANKFKGIYCGLVESEFTANECKIINNCNMLAMGSRVISEARACMAVDNWLNRKFNEGVPEQFVKIVADALVEIAKIEDKNFK